jgi:hypothetical protein
MAAFTTPRVTTTPESRLKDRAAMMVYEGRDRVIALVPYADSANLALIVLKQWQGDVVARPQLADRPCVGVALFTKSEWAQLTASGRRPSDVRPSEAAMRLRLYPATKAARAAVEDIGEGTAYVAIGLEHSQNTMPRTRTDSVMGRFKWSVQAYVDSARGPCTAE